MSSIEWHVTWSVRLLRHLSFGRQYKIAERLVNDANALRMASPGDGYEWVDRRKGLFKGMVLQEQANRINRSLAEVEDE